jgi:hypothetical protein
MYYYKLSIIYSYTLLSIGFIYSYWFNIISMMKKIYTFYYRNLLIEKIKDFILMQIYYYAYDSENYSLKHINNPFVNFYSDILNKGFEFNYINENLLNETIFKTYSKEFNFFIFTKNHFNTAMNHLIADRYLMRDIYINDNGELSDKKILITNKGKKHHLDGLSFERNYKQRKLQKFALYIAISSFIIATLSFLLKIN